MDWGPHQERRGIAEHAGRSVTADSEHVSTGGTQTEEGFGKDLVEFKAIQGA